MIREMLLIIKDRLREIRFLFFHGFEDIYLLLNHLTKWDSSLLCQVENATIMAKNIYFFNFIKLTKKFFFKLLKILMDQI